MSSIKDLECVVAAHGERPDPDILRVIFTGPLANLPSVANNHRAYIRHGHAQICHSKECLRALEALNSSYCLACKKFLGYLPAYSEHQKLVVFFDLGAINAPKDPDNTLKGVIDWVIVRGGMKKSDKGVWPILRPGYWYGERLDFTVLTIRKFDDIAGPLNAAWYDLNPREWPALISGTGATRGDVPPRTA